MATKIKRGVYKRGSAYYILLCLEKAVDGYIRLEDLGHRSYRYTYGYPDVKQSSLSRALKRLREGGYIKQDKLDTDLIYKLTDEGRNLFEIDNFDEKDWDGKWRVVVWDIPEQNRIVRNLFRRNLKKWGFKNFQKSVWVSKRAIFDKLSAYIDDLGIGQWVTVFEAERLSSNIKV